MPTLSPCKPPIKDKQRFMLLKMALLFSSLPPNKHKLVLAWVEIHKDDLLADWERAVNSKPPFKIRGLDQ